MMNEVEKYIRKNKVNPKCFVCEKDIQPEDNYEHVKQKNGNEIFMHRKCFEKRFLGK